MAIVWDLSLASDGGNWVLSNSDLTAGEDTTGTMRFLRANFPMTTGKWYWEIRYTGWTSKNVYIGISKDIGATNAPQDINSLADYIIFKKNMSSGTFGHLLKYLGGEETATFEDGTAPEPSAYMQIAVDVDDGKIWFGKNGSWVGGGDPAAGTDPTAFSSFSAASGPFYPTVGTEGNNTQINITANFGATALQYAAPAGFSTPDHLPPHPILFNVLNSLNVGQSIKLLTNIESTLDVYKELKPVFNLQSELFVVQPLQTRFNQKWSLTGFAIFQPVVSATYYRLTVIADGFSDMVLAMSSFQTRLRQGEPSYLQCSVPVTDWSVSDLEDRQDGELVIEMGQKWSDGTITVNEIARVDFERVRLDQGATSQTVTLSGHRSTTNASPKSVSLTGASIYSKDGSTVRYRTIPNNDLLPGDTASINGDSFEVATIQHVITPTLAYMEISNG